MAPDAREEAGPVDRGEDVALHHVPYPAGLALPEPQSSGPLDWAFQLETLHKFEGFKLDPDSGARIWKVGMCYITFLIVI